MAKNNQKPKPKPTEPSNSTATVDNGLYRATCRYKVTKYDEQGNPVGFNHIDAESAPEAIEKAKAIFEAPAPKPVTKTTTPVAPAAPKPVATPQPPVKEPPMDPKPTPVTHAGLTDDSKITEHPDIDAQEEAEWDAEQNKK